MSSSSGSNSGKHCCNVFNFTKKDLVKSGFYHTKLFDDIVCCGCGWKSCNSKLTLKEINFIHKMQNPDCKMSKYIDLDLTNYVKYICYVNEIKDCMKTTFATWPRQKPSADELVASGFYYTGEGDATTCMSCGVVLDHWDDLDLPNVEHEKANPNCELLNVQ